jgi:Na+/melibiose symporter-like transporter
VLFFVITFLTTRERIQPPPEQKSSVREDFRNLLKNGPWIAMFALTLLHFTYVALRSGSLFYYFTYYVDKDRLYDFLARLGLVASPAVGGAFHRLLDTFGLIVNETHSNVSSVGFSFFNMSSQAVLIIGVVASTFLAIRFGKKAVAVVGFSLATLFAAAFILLPSGAIGATFVLEWIRALCYSPTIPLIWAIFADVADYGEWTTGQRTTGLVYATIFFALKAGLSLGGAIGGWLLSAYGYQANLAQTAHTLLGIRLSASLFPAAFLAAVVVCMLFYKIGKQLNLRIQDELAQRRLQYAAGPNR